MPPTRMRRTRTFFLIATLWILGACARGPSAPPSGEPVVLLHGLGLNAYSLKKIVTGLDEVGYRTCRISYPSRNFPIDTLVVKFILPEIEKCFPGETRPMNFVTHSMGGILLRKIAILPQAPKIGRAVMIAPPNHGSTVVDRLGDWKAFGMWNGPAGAELGTDSNSVPNQLNRLGPPLFEFGIIAGNRSIQPEFSEWIPGPDDGIVGVESTKLPGMTDFVKMEASHTFILLKNKTVAQVLAFLKNGRFTQE